MTKEILLVQQHTGSYDDYCVQPLLATFEQEKADALIKSLEERKQRREANWNLLMLKMQEWEDQNPRPRISPIGIREDKKRAKKENRKYDPNDYLLWANQRMAYQESIVDTFGEEGKKDLYDFGDDTSWTIESIPFE
jgi:hypothetical protein